MMSRFNNCFIFGDLMLKTFRKYTTLPITVHLACLDPIPYIKPLILNGADYVAIHYEAKVDLYKTFEMIRSLGAKPVLAFRCDSKVPNDFITLAKEVEWILKLTVHPGFCGQSFHMEALQHIEEMNHLLKEAGIHKIIEADGNINVDAIYQCAKCGATMFTGGTSGLFLPNTNIQDNYETLKQSYMSAKGE